jgi:hypothetical protein
MMREGVGCGPPENDVQQLRTLSSSSSSSPAPPSVQASVHPRRGSVWRMRLAPW